MSNFTLLEKKQGKAIWLQSNSELHCINDKYNRLQSPLGERDTGVTGQHMAEEQVLGCLGRQGAYRRCRPTGVVRRRPTPPQQRGVPCPLNNFKSKI